MLTLAATGKIHWIGAAFVAILPLLKYLLQLLPLFKDQILPRKPSTVTTTTQSLDQACQVLGVTQPFNREQVIEAHRKLMQKLHPDRGGNDYLASQLNTAKETLLKHLEQQENSNNN